MNTAVNITAAAITASILVLCLAYIESAQGHDYNARSLRQVELIGLDSNICALGISEQMRKQGFLVTDRARASDAVLEVEILTDDNGLSDHSKIERAHYSAMLVGGADRVLFATGGHEEATDLEELCEDIGDDIADDLDNHMDV